MAPCFEFNRFLDATINFEVSVWVKLFYTRRMVLTNECITWKPKLREKEWERILYFVQFSFFNNVMHKRKEKESQRNHVKLWGNEILENEWESDWQKWLNGWIRDSKVWG